MLIDADSTPASMNEMLPATVFNGLLLCTRRQACDVSSGVVTGATDRGWPSGGNVRRR